MIFDQSLLIGPPHQVSGSVWVVDSQYEVDRLYERMMSSEGEVWGCDVETRDINSKEESPAKGNGRIVVWSAAYFDEKLGTHPTTGYPLAQRIFVKNWGEAEEKRWLYKFQEWFEGPQYKKVGANFFGFDRHVFGNYGINVQGVCFDNVRASRLNDASAMEHGLKFQAIEYLGYVMRDYNELFKRAKLKKDGTPGKQMVLVPLLTVVQDPDWLNILIDYASLDAKISLELWPVMRDKLAQKEWRRDGTTMADYYDTLQTPYYYVLNGAEREGWDLDEQWCSEQAEIATRDMDRLERELVEWTGVVMNFGSPKQLGHLLYATVPDTVVKANRNLIPGFGFAVPPVSKNKNRPKPWEEEDEENPFRPTDAMALQYLADNVRAKKDKKGLRTLLEWRKIKDIKKYLVGLPTFQDSKGRVHCSMAPETETGRLSARKPAIQQIPTPGKDAVADRYMIREAFTCPRGFALVGGDWSQLEMRILAHYLIVLFNDHKLAEDLTAADLHSATALRVFGKKDIQLPESMSRHLGGIHVVESWEQVSAFTEDLDKSKFLNELPFIPHDTPVKLVKKFFFSFRNKGKIINFCHKRGTLIATKRGQIPIEEVVVGDLVANSYGFCRVSDVSKNKRKERFHKLQTKNGYTVKPTEGHTYFVVGADGLPVERRAADIMSGDALILRAITEDTGHNEVEFALPVVTERTSFKALNTAPIWTESMAAYMGAACAEGYVSPAGISIGLVTDSDWIDCVYEHAQAAFPERVMRGKHTNKLGAEVHTIKLNSRQLSSWAKEHLGIGAANRHIPKDVFRLSRKLRCIFLSYLFEGDGSVGSCGISYATRSEQLSIEIQMLLLGVGIICSRKERFINYKGSKRAVYTLWIRGRENVDLFIRDVGFISDRKSLIANALQEGQRHGVTRFFNLSDEFKRQYGSGLYNRDQDACRLVFAKGIGVTTRLANIALKSWAESAQRRWLERSLSNSVWCDVVTESTFDCEVEEETFDLEVEEHREYTANGFVCHNSVNYGKSSYGLGNDLRDAQGDPIGQDAAQIILDAYFDAYPAVLRFQKWSIGYATKRGYARTLLGRYRPLPLIWDPNRGIRGHEERKAQNSPIQGSAADIAMMAQLKTNTVDMPELRDVGFFDEELYRMGVVHLMQIHDELIFKVPRAHANEACARIKMLMESPLDQPLTVPLPVEAKIGVAWSEIK